MVTKSLLNRIRGAVLVAVIACSAVLVTTSGCASKKGCDGCQMGCQKTAGEACCGSADCAHKK